ncbi:type II toxin-antitoxin system VapC family toxin [Microbacterium sp.]|uniref:type II toxin-antitoxin system VapC family toxin n=1 Tax=Microbacterium sp. TaxID=51671 RepID=UPI0039E4E23F
MRVAFDADVLIYAGAVGHPVGERIRVLLQDEAIEPVGSLLLLVEVLAKPMRRAPGSADVEALASVLSRLELLPLDEDAGRLALGFAVHYGLRAADAAHLATAVTAGAAMFVTNNRKDFPQAIAEIDVVFPDDLSI